jgi:hypothetical protein
MAFLVQFRRLHRGTVQVIRTLPFDGPDENAALASAKGLAGTRHWPSLTDSLRVMDESGRTLVDCAIPISHAHPYTSSLLPNP